MQRGCGTKQKIHTLLFDASLLLKTEENFLVCLIVLKLEFSTWVNLAGQVEVGQYLNIDVQKGTSDRRKV